MTTLGSMDIIVEIVNVADNEKSKVIYVTGLSYVSHYENGYLILHFYNNNNNNGDWTSIEIDNCDIDSIFFKVYGYNENLGSIDLLAISDLSKTLTIKENEKNNNLLFKLIENNDNTKTVSSYYASDMNVNVDIFGWIGVSLTTNCMYFGL